ncbi:GH1 family beta-glucosidase [Synoicihabitans lomoniglobus]|uniref:Beta-glucosidase n=1 Tax=Synoicihabitans lomoniglobus TaxID=2909285 RepID=A0AAF0CNB8_9BACT|nr:GH1 family beta-glucosidase [Opitutaceae bacterium LMO-M01]WED64235.1 GH1 family beta-glucosidase [Opitutaceae bacterium LMO-M01]
MSLPCNSTFPAGFIWGVATAAAQIEGAAFTDGKGESIWDRFARQPGKVHGGDTLDVACDHYHRFDEDFALMASLGVKHYRLSISWPRIYPDGDGELNQAGLDFYARLFDAMARHGITPWVTLFHWDLPQALEDRGGWRARETVEAFGRYATTVVQAFADRIEHWITLNEIRCFTQLAYGYGLKAPGVKVDAATLNQIYHHALVSHGLAVQAVRQYGGPRAQVGLTDNSDVCIPVTETPADIAAAREWYRRKNLHLLGAISNGGYSDEYLERCGKDAPKVAADDFALISAPTDFLGLNLYTGPFVRAGADGEPEEVLLPSAYPKADSPWLHWAPQVIYWGTRLAHETYGVKSIYITENGCGYNDEPVVAGEVNDLHRREFLRAHLRELQRAIADGIPVDGYFLWSFMDNFEWEDGYERRFGIVHVDFATQQRTPKLSAHYYAAVISANRVV